MREWLVDLVGEELAPMASWALAATIVIILVIVVIQVAKMALGGSMGPRTKGRGPRLAIMDVAAIDPKRKLVLVRRDEVEHLLLIGGQNDLVVEQHIVRAQASSGRGQRTEPTMRADHDPQPLALERSAPSIGNGAAVASRVPAATPVQRTPAPQRLAPSPLARALPTPPAPI
ncbi:MAG: flagellar biosynthetic protein FliO, partial [Rhizobiaceae bacterium]|nr:flagellar biosynthetic protein FliO [Rhizobiaceae bacterium]